MFPLIEPTDFVVCVPEQYKTDDVVESYRRYYRFGKPFAKWDKLNNIPDWWGNYENI